MIPTFHAVLSCININLSYALSTIWVFTHSQLPESSFTLSYLSLPPTLNYLSLHSLSTTWVFTHSQLLGLHSLSIIWVTKNAPVKIKKYSYCDNVSSKFIFLWKIEAFSMLLQNYSKAFFFKCLPGLQAQIRKYCIIYFEKDWSSLSAQSSILWNPLKSTIFVS